MKDPEASHRLEWGILMAVSTPERKAAALAVATVLIVQALLYGYAWLWPDGTDGGAPSYVGYSFTVAIFATGFASFFLSRRFTPSAYRWYYRTLIGLLSLSYLLALAV